MINDPSLQPWTVDKFDGGITDKYVNAEKNKYQYATNLLLNTIGRLETRGSFRILYPGDGRIPAAAQINGLVAFPAVEAISSPDTLLLAVSARNIYFQGYLLDPAYDAPANPDSLGAPPAGWNTIYTPSGNPAFGAGTIYSHCSFAKFQDQVYAVNDAFSSPQVIYVHGLTNRLICENAGLPRPSTDVLNNCLFQGTWNAATNAPALASGVGTAGYYYYVSTAGATALDGTTTWAAGDMVFFNGATSKWEKHQASIAVDNGANAPRDHSYVYAFHFMRIYKVGKLKFMRVGPVTLVPKNGTQGSSQVHEIDGLNPLIINVSQNLIANGSTENFPLNFAPGLPEYNGLFLVCYRTTNNGTLFYHVATVPVSTTGIVQILDGTKDDALPVTSNMVDNITPPELYTSGGTVEFEPAPKAKFVTILNNVAYYGHVQETSTYTRKRWTGFNTFVMETVTETVTYKNRIRQSVPGAPYASPGSFFDDLDDEVTGLSNTGDIPLVFCKSKIYRLNGQFDELGRGFIDHVRISDTAGCVSNASIVQLINGVVFAGLDGFYFTDGFNVQKISTEFTNRYLSLVTNELKKGNIVGKLDVAKNRVFWAVQQTNTPPTEALSINDAFFVLDLNFGSMNAGVFTTLEANAYTMTAVEYYDDRIVFADKNGYIFQHAAGVYSDARIDTTESNDLSWDTQAIRYKYAGPSTNFGIADIRKWVPGLNFQAINHTDLSLQLSSINDDSDDPRPLKLIRYRGDVVWNITPLIWGDPDMMWDMDAIIDIKRKFPTRRLRCKFKQLVMENAYTVIARSALYGPVTVNKFASTALLVDSAHFAWPTDAVDYKIYFEADGYVNGFTVLSRTDDTLTFDDPNGIAPLGVQQWELKGYPKDEKFELLSYTMFFTLQSRSEYGYRAGDDAEQG